MKKQEIQSFGEAFNGKTPSKNEQRSSGPPILKIRDIDETGRFRGVFESFVDHSFYEKHAKKKLKAGDTIILNAAHNADYVGSKNAFVPAELDGVIATGEWLIVRAKEANPKYVNQYLKSPSGRKSLKNCVKGIHLYPKDVERIPVPLPSLENQIRIAHLLGKVERLIAQRKQHLQQFNDLLKSVFLEMFGDPIVNPRGFPIRRLSEFYINPKEGTKCGPFGSALKKEELVDSGIPVWNMDNIGPAGQMVLPFRMWITPDKFAELAAYSVQDGDIVISRAGTVGKMCVVRMQAQRAIISTNLIRLRLGPELRPLHFVSLMLYCKGRVGRLKTGADGAFTHMNTGVLDSLEFPYPPIELQNQFAEVAHKVEGIKFRYQQSLADLEALYGTLSQKAFKGELDLSRVPLPADQAPQIDPAPPLKGLVRPTEVLNRLVQNAPPESRNELLARWFNRYLANTSPDVSLGSREFLEAGWQTLQETRLESEGESPALTLADYDALKDLVFAALEGGTLVQTFAEESNRVSLQRRPADWGSF